MTVSAAALIAQGAPISLTTGAVVHLRYDMLSLARLEQDFGDVTAAPRQLALAGLRAAGPKGAPNANPLDLAEAAKYDGPGMVTLLPRLLQPGLIGQIITVNGERVDLGEIPAPEFLRLLRVQSLHEYAHAFQAAFAEAFDTGEAPAPAPGAPRDHLAKGSRSRTSTTSRAAKPAEPMSSSGA